MKLKSYCQKFFLSLFLLNIVFLGCSSEDNAPSGIVINGPKTIEITAKHEEFTVQFSKISGIGAADNPILPYFEFFINKVDNIDTAENIGKVQQLNDGSGLMRLFIKPAKIEADGDNIVLEYPIKDEIEYFVYIRACYESYGCSGYTMTKAAPVPYPSKLTEDDVEVYAGDKTILIKIKNKSKYDEFGILADDDCLNPKLQRFDPKYNTSLDNFVITNLANNKPYPICIRAQNNNTDTSNPDTISWLQLGKIGLAGYYKKGYNTYVLDDSFSKELYGINYLFQQSKYKPKIASVFINENSLNSKISTERLFSKYKLDKLENNNGLLIIYYYNSEKNESRIDMIAGDGLKSILSESYMEDIKKML
ncbi:MAG: hypothetical protein K2N11_03290 [Mucispirillum sp.]|nr:hypothetical protein [Mucispirillum sp.]